MGFARNRSENINSFISEFPYRALGIMQRRDGGFRPLGRGLARAHRSGFGNGALNTRKG